MSSQYGERRPTNGWDRFTSLGHPSNFNGFRILASLLQCRRSTEANQTLHDVWLSPGLVHYVYIFGGSCPVTEFCQVQNSLCVQVLDSNVLAILLHDTRVVGGSQTLRRWAEGATYIPHGGRHVWHLLTDWQYFGVFGYTMHDYLFAQKAAVLKNYKGLFRRAIDGNENRLPELIDVIYYIAVTLRLTFGSIYVRLQQLPVGIYTGWCSSQQLLTLYIPLNWSRFRLGWMGPGTMH